MSNYDWDTTLNERQCLNYKLSLGTMQSSEEIVLRISSKISSWNKSVIPAGCLTGIVRTLMILSKQAILGRNPGFRPWIVCNPFQALHHRVRHPFSGPKSIKWLHPICSTVDHGFLLQGGWYWWGRDYENFVPSRNKLLHDSQVRKAHSTWIHQNSFLPTIMYQWYLHTFASENPYVSWKSLQKKNMNTCVSQKMLTPQSTGES